MFISCLRKFLSQFFLHWSMLGQVCVILAALYSLCFFLHNLPWVLLNLGRLKRLDEVLMEMFLSIVDFNAFSSSFQLWFTDDSVKLDMKKSQKDIISSFILSMLASFLIKIFRLGNFFFFGFKLMLKTTMSWPLVPWTTTRLWIIDSLLVKTKSKMFCACLCRLVGSRTICWIPCFSSSSNSFLAEEKGADVIEFLLQSIFGMLKSPVRMMLWLLILWPNLNRDASRSSKYAIFFGL